MEYIPKDKLKLLIDTLTIGGYNDNNKKTINGETIKRGSFFSYKLKFASDIDLNEYIKVNSELNTIVNRFREMGRKIKANKDFIFIKFRSGVDKKYYINIGYIDLDGKIKDYDYHKIYDHVENLYQNKHLSQHEYLKIKEYLKKNLSYEDFFDLKEVLTYNYTICWTLDELIDGKKGDIKLEDILIEDRTKVDIIFKYGYNKYIEASNVYHFMIDNKIVNYFSGEEVSRIEYFYYYYLVENNYLKCIKLFRSLINDQKIKNNIKYKIRNDIAKFLNSKYGYMGYMINKFKLILDLLDRNIINKEDAKKMYIYLWNTYYKISSNNKNTNKNTNKSIKNVNNINKNLSKIDKNKIKEIIEISIQSLCKILNKIAHMYLKNYYNQVKNSLSFKININS